MSNQQQHESHETQQPAGKPSQAEGERNPGDNQAQTQSPAGKPSQAEGSREQIEQDIEEKLGG